MIASTPRRHPPETRILFALLLLTAASAEAAKPPWLENTRIALDLSGRGMWEAESGERGAVSFVGVDSHHVFSSDRGDIGTLLVQIYLTSLYDVDAYPRRSRTRTTPRSSSGTSTSITPGSSKAA